MYDELRKLAAARMAAENPGHTLDATALVHEAYLHFVGDQPVRPVLRPCGGPAGQVPRAETGRAGKGTSPFRSALECYLSSTADAKPSQETLALMRELVKASKNPNLWQRLSIGMGEHRTGDHAAAIETLREAGAAANTPNSGFKILIPVAESYRAMALFRLGKKDEAKALLAEVAKAMPPVPKDELLTSQITHDAQQLLVWLSFKEAKSLIGIDAAPPLGKK